MKQLRALLLLAIFCLPAYSQQVNVTANKLKGSATAPSGTCAGQSVYLTTAGAVYVCTSGTWQMLVGSGGAISGSGAANRLTLWSGASAQTSDADLSYALDSLNAPNLSVLEKQRWAALDSIGSFSNGGSAGSGNVRLGDTTSTIVSDGAYNAFPGIVRLPDGRLLVVYRAGTGHTTGGVLKYKISDDQGATWSAATMIYTASGNEQVQDTEVTLLRNGLIFVSWFNYNTVTTLSASKSMLGTIASDGTITWGSPRAITSNFTTETVASAKAVELPDGSLIIPVYGKGAGDTYYSTASVKSTDQGATWGSHVVIASTPASKQYNEAAIVRLPNGTLVAIVRHETDLTGYDRSVSTDNGATWSAPSTVINLSGSLPGRPSLAALGSGGLFMLYRAAPATTVGYATSWDDGTTWSTSSFGASTQLFEYGSVVLQSGGSIAVAYSQSTDVGDTAADLFYREFYDGYGLFGGGTVEAKNLRVGTLAEFSANVGIYQSSPTTALQLGGTAARTISIGRNTGGAAGQALTIQAGGASEFFNNVAGGALNLRSGLTTGTGVSADINFQTPDAGGSGSSDNSFSTKVVIKGPTGALGVGAAPATGNMLSVYGSLSAGSYGAVAAPSNGMIISGIVGIGTSTPGVLNSVSYGNQLTIAGNGGMALSSAQPYWLMNETDAAANSRLMDFSIDAGVFQIRKYTDAGGSVVSLLSLIRSSGNMGINTSVADKQLEINSTTGATLRHTFNDINGSAANYVDESVTIEGNFTITPSGGLINLAGGLVMSGTPQTLTGPGAVNLTTFSTLLVTTGADALTLAAGAEGQAKFIRMKTHGGGDGTLTVTNLLGGTTITFNSADDFVLLFYQDGKWHIFQNSGCVVA